MSAPCETRPEGLRVKTGSDSCIYDLRLVCRVCAVIRMRGGNNHPIIIGHARTNVRPTTLSVHGPVLDECVSANVCVGLGQSVCALRRSVLADVAFCKKL